MGVFAGNVAQGASWIDTEQGLHARLMAQRPGASSQGSAVSGRSGPFQDHWNENFATSDRVLSAILESSSDVALSSSDALALIRAIWLS